MDCDWWILIRLVFFNLSKDGLRKISGKHDTEQIFRFYVVNF